MKQQILSTPAGSFQLMRDDHTFWLNNPAGESLARFGRLGIDVHRTTKEQIQGMGQCLACHHQPTSPKDWQSFTEICRKEFGVTIPHTMKPGFLNASRKAPKLAPVRRDRSLAHAPAPPEPSRAPGGHSEIQRSQPTRCGRG